jgi:hypothetical protein
VSRPSTQAIAPCSVYSLQAGNSPHPKRPRPRCFGRVPYLFRCRTRASLPTCVAPPAEESPSTVGQARATDTPTTVVDRRRLSDEGEDIVKAFRRATEDRQPVEVQDAAPDTDEPATAGPVPLKKALPPRARDSRSAAVASLLGTVRHRPPRKTSPEGGRWQGLDVAARSLRCRRWFREFGLIAHTGGAYLQNGPNSSAKAKRPRISNSAAN